MVRLTNSIIKEKLKISSFFLIESWIGLEGLGKGGEGGWQAVFLEGEIDFDS